MNESYSRLMKLNKNDNSVVVSDIPATMYNSNQ